MANKSKEECDQIIESGVCHFTIGEDFGAMLMRIAQENLEYGNDPVKALKTITESLIGCPTDLAVQILKGDIVLTIDVDTQEVLPMNRIEGIHDNYPKIDVMYYMNRMKRDICQSGNYIKTGLRYLQNDIKRNYGRFTMSFDYDMIFKFIAGNNYAILEELRDDRDIHSIENLILTTKDYIAQTMKVQNTMDWMMKTWDDFSETANEGEGNKNFCEYRSIKGECSDILLDVMQLFQETLALDMSKFKDFNPIEDDNVTKYIESAMAIDEVIKSGIEPVDIMDNYSAGWLSPEGVYYGMNGEIANMIHIQIADALVEKGIIPAINEHGDKLDGALADQWLEQNGWIKIHKDNINYGGCLNDKIGKKNVNITCVQAKLIYEYICACHNSIVALGWKRQKISAIKFKEMAELNPDLLNKEYFEF
jgi:hypothetical protein